MHVQPEAVKVKIGNRPLWAPGAPNRIKDFIGKRQEEVRILEFGSGASTIFLLRCGATVTTVEHHEAWALGLQQAAESRGLGARLTILRRDRPYHDVVAEFPEGTTFDILLVDGRERIECFRKALPLVKLDGLVLLDDSQRSRYWPAFTLLAERPCVTYESDARNTSIWFPIVAHGEARFIEKSFVPSESSSALMRKRAFVPAAFLSGTPIEPGYIKKEPIVGLAPIEAELQQIGLIERKAIYLAPSVFALENASVKMEPKQKLLCHGGEVYKSRSGQFIRSEMFPPFEGATDLPGTTLDLTAPGAGLYSFFLLDSLPKLELLGASGYLLDDFDSILLNSGAKWVEDIFSAVTNGRARKLVSFSDKHPSFRMERSVHIEGIRSGRFTPQWVHLFLDQHFRTEHVPDANDESFGPLVYISREKAYGRRIVNHDQFLALIKPLGFVEVFAEDHPPAQLAHKLRDAEVVISPHGAGLANAIFCPKTTTIVELFSSHYTPQYFNLARDRGQGYFAVPCVDAEGKNVFDRYDAFSKNKSEFNRADIVVPVDKLAALLHTLRPPTGGSRSVDRVEGIGSTAGSLLRSAGAWLRRYDFRLRN